VILTPGDFDTGWRTVWMEARDQGDKGMYAVAWVLRNRLERKANDRWATIGQVCLDWLQFSGWRENDPNFKQALVVPLDTLGQRCAIALLRAMSDPRSMDPTGGSCHYYSTKVMKTPPAWAVGKTPVACIGDHAFFAGVV